MELIRPSEDLRNHYHEIVTACKEAKQAVYITVNDRSDTFLMALAQYEHMKAELELLRMLVDSEEDVRMGRVAPIEEAFEGLRRNLI